MEGARKLLTPLEVRREAPGDPGEVGFRMEIPADVRCVEPAVQLMSDHCFSEGPPPAGRTVFRLRVLLAEAISNSILFGAEGNPERTVRIEARISEERIRVQVTDDGPGFDPSDIPDPTLPDGLGRPVGRGLFLIRSLADRVEFNEQGNTIWMTLARC